MARVKSRKAAALGSIAGIALLVFAGTLLVCSPLYQQNVVVEQLTPLEPLEKLDELAPERTLFGVNVVAAMKANAAGASVPFSRTTLSAATTNGTSQISLTDPNGFAIGATIEVGEDLTKETVVIIASNPTTPVFTVRPALVQEHAVGENVKNIMLLAGTELVEAAVTAQNFIKVADNPGGIIVVGNDITIGNGTDAEPGQVTAITGSKPSIQLTLQFALTKDHAVATEVFVQASSIYEQLKKQSSSGPSESLRTSNSRSSNSLAGLQSGSLKNNAWATLSTYGGSFDIGYYFAQFFVVICFATCYKRKAVDPVGFLHEQAGNPELHDQFEYPLFACLGMPSLCCFIMCCPFIRVAHNNHVTEVCGFWQTLVSMVCCSVVPCGPLCLNVYFLMHVKDHLGIEDHCVQDICVTMCCFPCSIGQQAASVDHAMGYEYHCPCDMEFVGSPNGEDFMTTGVLLDRYS